MKKDRDDPGAVKHIAKKLLALRRPPTREQRAEGRKSGSSGRDVVLWEATAALEAFLTKYEWDFISAVFEPPSRSRRQQKKPDEKRETIPRLWTQSKLTVH